MPRSRRDKKVSLTQTKKKGLQRKQDFINEVRDCIDKFDRIFAFSIDNSRNSHLKKIRHDWKNSRFFFGRNKILMVAMGRNPESEYSDGIHKLSKLLSGQMGLLFTSRSSADVKQYFSELNVADYARAGCQATESVTIEAGAIPQFSHAIEPYLRQQLGMMTTLEKGVITLGNEHVVCKQGETLTSQQARILKLFGYQMATFHLNIIASWEKSTGSFEEIDISRTRDIADRKGKKGKGKKAVIKPASAPEAMETDVGFTIEESEENASLAKDTTEREQHETNSDSDNIDVEEELMS